MTLGGYTTDAFGEALGGQHFQREASKAAQSSRVINCDGWSYCIVEPESYKEPSKKSFIGAARGPSRAPDGSLLLGTMLGETEKKEIKLTFEQSLEEPCARILSYEGDSTEVEIPSTLGGYSVKSVHNKAFFGNKTVCRITVPDSVIQIGSKAFSKCRALEEIVLPANMKELDPSILIQCSALKSVYLPEELRKLPTRFFDGCPIETLRLPRALEVIEDHSFDPATVKTVLLDRKNTHFSCDGTGLYSADSSVFVKLMRSVSSYTIRQHCKVIGPNACKSMKNLKRLHIPEGVETISSYALFGTGLERIFIPPTVTLVDRHAFHNCHELKEAIFNKGLVQISPFAFANSALEKVYLPKTLKMLSRSAFEGCPIDYANGTSFVIDEMNPYLHSGKSALYRITSSGLELLSALGNPETCEVCRKTYSVHGQAFAYAEHLKSVYFHEGIEHIGARAFTGCTALETVNFPDSLVSIGQEAFWETSLSEARLGPNVSFIGDGAFATSGSNRRLRGKRIKKMSIDPANEHYYVENDLLIEKINVGHRVIQALACTTDFYIPDEVTYISSKAFCFMEVNSLRFPRHLSFIAANAFFGITKLKSVEFYKPQGDDFRKLKFLFPAWKYAVDRYAEMLSLQEDGSFFNIESYDSWVRSCGEPENFAMMTLARLEDPYMLSEERAKRFRWGIQMGMKELLKHHISNHDVAFLKRLSDLDLLDFDSIAYGMELASKYGESSITAFLLEAKRKSVGSNGFEEDFSL